PRLVPRRRMRVPARAGEAGPAAARGSPRGTPRRARARTSRRFHSFSRGRVEQMRLVRPRAQRDLVAAPRDVPRLRPRHELQVLAADLGDAEDVRVRAQLLDYLDAGAHSARPDLERLGAQAEDAVCE